MVIDYNKLHIDTDPVHASDFLKGVLNVFDNKEIMREIYFGILDRFHIAQQYAEHMREAMSKIEI